MRGNAGSARLFCTGLAREDGGDLKADGKRQQRTQCKNGKNSSSKTLLRKCAVCEATGKQGAACLKDLCDCSEASLRGRAKRFRNTGEKPPMVTCAISEHMMGILWERRQ